MSVFFKEMEEREMQWLFLSSCIALFHEQYIYVYPIHFIYIQQLLKYIFLLRKIMFIYSPSFGKFRSQALGISSFSVQFVEHSEASCHYLHAMPKTRDFPAR